MEAFALTPGETLFLAAWAAGIVFTALNWWHSRSRSTALRLVVSLVVPLLGILFALLTLGRWTLSAVRHEG